MHESVQERTPEESQNKVAGNVTVTSMKWQLYLTPSTYTLQSPSHLYFSHFCLNFIPQHSFPWTSTHKAPFPFKAHFFISHCFLADREICLHHTYENLPTIVSEALSSDKNFFVSWVEFFREIFAEKKYTWLCKFLQWPWHSEKVPIPLPHSAGSLFGLGKDWESPA